MTKTLPAVLVLSMVAAFAVPAHANLVVNGGFETGDFTGWIQSGNLGFTFVDGNPHSGNDAAWLGPIGSDGFLSQILATTPGQSYSLDFWLYSFGGTPNDFSARWNGTPVFSQSNIPANPYALNSFTVFGTGSDTLTFGFRNDPSYLLLDDVSVEASGPVIPEPGTLMLVGSGLIAIARRRRVTHG